MTPKEKAKELIKKFKNPVKPDESYSDYNVNYLACALIAVDEILKSHYKVFTGSNSTLYDYYQEVKQEIEKL